jgi:hypothetical protein
MPTVERGENRSKVSEKNGKKKNDFIFHEKSVDSQAEAKRNLLSCHN